MTRPTLILFTKAPRWGTVKSRLAARIGQREALRFHRAQVARLTHALRDPRWRLVLAVTPDAARGPWSGGLPVVGQGRGDLGERMIRALNGALNGKIGPAALIGSDIPAVTRAHIARAFALLRRADAVFGPAEDGGFWLLGLRHPLPEDSFAGVAWSTGRTLAECLARVPGESALADRLADVDDTLNV
ncbi:TIGR04282 family arsenosugar biosynthesis glycosyltransferase [Novispirillum sp. DQ9]|uniref:TIGR04282 family arsenosugar biosynthesis glycosyltransferase n=1 Tax=Novispirillum sp. DQ9 TaxID=3398612 RepID=UPI003C7E0A5F